MIAYLIWRWRVWRCDREMARLYARGRASGPRCQAPGDHRP